MQLLFTVCLGVGIGYTIISFILGNLFNVGDVSGDIDTGSSVSFFKPTSIAAFLTVFGGMGLVFLNSFNFITVVSLSSIFGIFVAYLLHRFVLIPLHNAQNTSTVEKQSLIGSTAKISQKVLQGGFGKITYHVNGSTFSSPAKSEDGNEIPLGTTVEIIYIEKNTYYVKPKYDH